jgi:tetratricopeptide (TPR) repeat protein
VEPPRYQYLDLAKPAPGNRAAAEPLVAAGYQAQKARKLDEAARQYTAALQKDPSYFEACYNLTLVALDVGDLRAALHASELAVAIKPESAEARITLATALDRSGYWNDAVDQLEKVLKTSPEDAKAHLLLGNVFAQKLNLPGRARPHYQRVIEIEPRHPRASEIRYWLAANP